MIYSENRKEVAVLRMEDGKVNAMDIEFMEQLRDRLREANESECKAVLLTGSGKAFSAGVDLFRVLKDGKEYVRRFLPLLSSGIEELFLFPRPVIAAVNGHAIAGGCILACCCDYRIAAAGGAQIGVPELLVGVPFPPVALEVMRFALSDRHLPEVVYSGRYYSVEDARQRGMLDEIAESETLLNRACEIARGLAAIPSESFRLTKRQIRGVYMERAARISPNIRDLIDNWSSAEVHSVIRQHLDRTIGRNS